MEVLCGRAGRLTAQNGDFRPHRAVTNRELAAAMAERDEDASGEVT